MNKFIKKAISVVCAAVATTTLFACGGGKETKCPYTLPDYSAAERELKLFGYYTPGSGKYVLDGVPYYTQNNITVEKYTEYKEAGFNIASVNGNDALGKNESFEGSDAQKMFKTAKEAGIDRVILIDSYFTSYLMHADNYGGDNSVFKSEQEFQTAVEQRVSQYKNEPNFYGLMLFDEPSWKNMDNYGKIYRALRKALPDAFFHCNFHPATASSAEVCDLEGYKKEHGRYPTDEEAYEEYFRVFFTKTGANRVSVDAYPFLSQSFKQNYYSGLQIMKKVCDEFGAELAFTVQSLAFYRKGTLENRAVSKSDMWLQMNSVLGFGADTVAYYTYMPFGIEEGSTRYLTDGSFLRKDGTPTNIYYYGKEIMTAVNKFSNVLMNYKYKGAKIYLGEVIGNGSAVQYTDGSRKFDNSYEFELLKGLTQDNDAVLATELFDEKNGLYMYMLLNAIDPGYDSRNGNTAMTITADFTGYEWVAEFDCGELNYVKLTDGKYTKTLSAGYATYLIPLK